MIPRNLAQQISDAIEETTGIRVPAEQITFTKHVRVRGHSLNVTPDDCLEEPESVRDTLVDLKLAELQEQTPDIPGCEVEIVNAGYLGRHRHHTMADEVEQDYPDFELVVRRGDEEFSFPVNPYDQPIVDLEEIRKAVQPSGPDPV